MIIAYLYLLTKKLNPEVKWITLVTELGKGRTRIEIESLGFKWHIVIVSWMTDEVFCSKEALSIAEEAG